MDCRRSLASCVTLSLLAGCGVPSEGLRGADGEVDASADVSSPDAPAPADVASLADGACVSTRAYFEARAWPEVFVRCATCHVPGGEAGTTRFVLRPASVADHLPMNYEVVRAAASLQMDGRPLLLLKPTAMVPHGGMTVIAPGSPAHAVLQSALDQLARPIACGAPPPPPPPPRGIFDGVTLLDAEATLRRASLQLAGRVPTAAERATVRAGGLDALDGVLRPMMRERGFHDRVMEVFNDVIMTDRSLTAIGYGGAYFHINERVFPQRDYAGPTWMPPGRRVADSVVRRPAR